jgi:hypothetical protein
MTPFQWRNGYEILIKMGVWRPLCSLSYQLKNGV